MFRFAALVLVLACSVLPAAGSFPPDPHSVQRYGAGYRYPQAGWIVLHIEGDPYDRGVQHGRLLAPEIAAHIRCMAATLGHKSPEDAWKNARTLSNALFLRGYAKEYLEEMKGIADGASAAGARFAGRRLDLIDIVTLNSWPEIVTLDGGLEAAPMPLDGLRFPLQNPKPKMPPKADHCSAFAATGPATKDGKVVFGHITMFSLYPSNFYNVWLDVKPSKGQRVLMQSFPGGIHSGMDYYMNDAGLLISETTIAQTRFDVKGLPLASRIRQAMQYGDSIEKAVAILEKGNNGLYTNEWLLADTKTNEIAMFELGTHKSKLWRSSKDEWYGGTKGFYWGCNNTKDLNVRLETLATTSGRPANTVFVPSLRDLKWLKLFDEHNGKMDEAFGKLAFTTPPVCASSSLDAKFTTTDMAKKLQTWALFGPPMGRTWEPSFSEKTRFPEVRALVSNPWTILHPEAPIDATKKTLAVDLHDPSKDSFPTFGGDRLDLDTTPAWHGTILAKNDGALWLASSFASCERYVSQENAIKKARKDGKLTAKDRDRLAVSRHVYRTQYEAGVRAAKDTPLSKITPSVRDSSWHKIAQGKGVLLLLALREQLGAETFDKAMDAFGTMHAGKEVTTEQFREHVNKTADKKLDDFLTTWLDGEGLPNGSAIGGPFTVASFHNEIENAMIVYGTKEEGTVNRESAQVFQESLRRRGSNVIVPIKSDKEVTDADLKSKHLLLLGRPSVNAISERFAKSLPVTFGPESVKVREDVYAHADTSLIVAAENPMSKRYSVVVIAGLSAQAMREAIVQYNERGGFAGEVVVSPMGRSPQTLVIGRGRK